MRTAKTRLKVGRGDVDDVYPESASWRIEALELFGHEILFSRE